MLSTETDLYSPPLELIIQTYDLETTYHTKQKAQEASFDIQDN